MNKTPVIKHLFSLEKSEIKAFRLWLTSPFMNTRQEVLDLYDWIIKEKATNKTELSKEAAFVAIFPNQPYEVQQLRYIMSYLLEQLRQFFIWQTLQTDKVQQQTYLLENLRKRGLEKAFAKQLQKATDLLEKGVNRNPKHYFQNYQLQLERFEFSYRYGREAKIPLKEITTSFTIFSIANLLKWHCNMVAHRSISDVNYDVAFLQQILTHLKEGFHQDVPAIQIYYKIYLALTTGEEIHYITLKKLILQYFAYFPGDEIRDIFLLTINFCIKKLNRGESDFLKETFEWYKKGFETKILIQNNEFSRYTYNNVIIIALKLSEYDWAKQFMEKYKKHIIKTEQHDTYYYNLALWYQYQKQYEEVQTLLQKVTFKDVLHALHAKRILLKIYYENQSFKALESLLESIRVYLYRHKKLGYHKENYLKLIRFTQKLIRLNPYDKMEKTQFRKEVEEEKSLLEKKWFLEMM